MKQWTGTLLLFLSMNIHAIQTNYTITNAITKKMTGYDFRVVTYYPKEFSVYVEDKLLKTGQSLEIPSSNKMVSVRYEYTFREFGICRKGKKIVDLKLCPDKKNYDLNFCWYDAARISAEGAEVARVIDLLKASGNG